MVLWGVPTISYKIYHVSCVFGFPSACVLTDHDFTCCDFIAYGIVLRKYPL
jgi:hypothetical protein